MLHLDPASWRKLDELAQGFDTSMGEVIRQLVARATPKQFPKNSSYLRAEAPAWP
jgi:hypothetical protein